MYNSWVCIGKCLGNNFKHKMKNLINNKSFQRILIGGLTGAVVGPFIRPVYGDLVSFWLIVICALIISNILIKD